MANEKTKVEAKSTAASKEDVELKGVKVVYIDNPARLERVYKQRVAEGKPGDMGNVFVHMTIEMNGGQYNGLSQTLRVLGKDDYAALLKAHDEGSPIDIVVRRDPISAKTGNYFFFVSHGNVTVDDLFSQPFVKPTIDRKSVVDLLDD